MHLENFNLLPTETILYFQHGVLSLLHPRHSCKLTPTILSSSDVINDVFRFAVCCVNTGLILTVVYRLGCACSSTLVEPCDGVIIHSEGLGRPGFDLNFSTENNVSLVVREGVVLGSMQ